MCFVVFSFPVPSAVEALLDGLRVGSGVWSRNVRQGRGAPEGITCPRDPRMADPAALQPQEEAGENPLTNSQSTASKLQN